MIFEKRTVAPLNLPGGTAGLRQQHKLAQLLPPSAPSFLTQQQLSKGLYLPFFFEALISIEDTFICVCKHLVASQQSSSLITSNVSFRLFSAITSPASLASISKLESSFDHFHPGCDRVSQHASSIFGVGCAGRIMRSWWAFLRVKSSINGDVGDGSDSFVMQHSKCKMLQKVCPRNACRAQSSFLTLILTTGNNGKQQQR